MKKYRLMKSMSKNIEYNGEKITLYRIKALKDINNADVHAGDIGGWIAGEDNLSRDGDCWVFDEAMVFDNACVSGDSMICDHAVICFNARITGESIIEDNALISGFAMINNSNVNGNATVTDHATVYEHSHICDDAHISNNAHIYHSRVRNNAHVSGNSNITNGPVISDNVSVSGDSVISGKVIIKENALIDSSPIINGRDIVIKSNAKVYGGRIYSNVVLDKNAFIVSNKDFFVVNTFTSTYTFYRNNKHLCVVISNTSSGMILYTGNIIKLKKKIKELRNNGLLGDESYDIAMHTIRYGIKMLSINTDNI